VYIGRNPFKERKYGPSLSTMKRKKNIGLSYLNLLIRKKGGDPIRLGRGDLGSFPAEASCLIHQEGKSASTLGER